MAWADECLAAAKEQLEGLTRLSKGRRQENFQAEVRQAEQRFAHLERAISNLTAVEEALADAEAEGRFDAHGTLGRMGEVDLEGPSIDEPRLCEPDFADFGLDNPYERMCASCIENWLPHALDKVSRTRAAFADAFETATRVGVAAARRIGPGPLSDRFHHPRPRIQRPRARGAGRPGHRRIRRSTTRAGPDDDGGESEPAGLAPLAGVAHSTARRRGS